MKMKRELQAETDGWRCALAPLIVTCGRDGVLLAAPLHGHADRQHHLLQQSRMDGQQSTPDHPRVVHDVRVLVGRPESERDAGEGDNRFAQTMKKLSPVESHQLMSLITSKVFKCKKYD